MRGTVMTRGFCRCQGIDTTIHEHYPDDPHSCARCRCTHYDPVVSADTFEAVQAALLQRGPWWWRLRVWLSQRITTIGCDLEPDDLSSVSWQPPGEDTIWFSRVRRK